MFKALYQPQTFLLVFRKDNVAKVLKLIQVCKFKSSQWKLLQGSHNASCSKEQWEFLFFLTQLYNEWRFHLLHSQLLQGTLPQFYYLGLFHQRNKDQYVLNPFSKIFLFHKVFSWVKQLVLCQISWKLGHSLQEWMFTSLQDLFQFSKDLKKLRICWAQSNSCLHVRLSHNTRTLWS